MSYKFNLDEIQELKFLEREGEFEFEVIDHKRGVASTGNEYDQYTCKNRDGEIINVFFTIVKNAMWKYKAFIKALGHPAKGNVDFENIPSKIAGKSFVGVVQAQERTNVVDGSTTIRYDITTFKPVDLPF